MRFASYWIGALLGSLLLSGCAVSSTEALNENPQNNDDTTETTYVDAAIAFEGPQTIEIVPGSTTELSVVTSPAAEYEMYFALLDAPSDASLDASHLFSGLDGRATVKLHAPSSPSTFTVRASIKNGPSAEITATVSKQGIGTIEVVPTYDGKRTVEKWVASVVAGATCDDLAGVLPGEPKGALVAITPENEHPFVQSIPVGPKLAVSVRAGHFAWGCTDTAGISAGTTTKVKIHVVDVALALDRTSLDLSFSLKPQAALLDTSRAAFLSAFLPNETAEHVALLDTMMTLAANPAAFGEARDMLGWDAVAEAHIANLVAPPDVRLAQWIDKGFDLALPELTGQLLAIEGVPGKALFKPSTIAGIDASLAGAPPGHVFSWTSEPFDKVFLGGTLFFLPSRFIGAACQAGATDNAPDPAPMGELLAQETDCDALAAQLGGFSECDATCLAGLCGAALSARWQTALDASAQNSAVGTIQIGTSAQVEVDDVAIPVTLTGSWLGQISDGATTVTVQGDVKGSLIEPEVPDPADPNPEDPPQ